MQVLPSHPSLPTQLPKEHAIASWRQNIHDYEPEFWEFHYRIRPFLGRVTDDALIERYESISLNLAALSTPDRDVIPSISFLSSWYWFRKEHMTRMEFHMRNLTCPIPQQIFRVAPTAPIRPKRPNSGDVLYKFGSPQWLLPMINEGSIRIAHSSYYLKLENDAARRDNEAMKDEYWPGAFTKVTQKDGSEIPIIGDMKVTVSTRLSYYLYCVSLDWDAVLFADFNSDACVVIRDPQSFEHRMRLASSIALTGWEMNAFSVEYFDPYEPGEHQRIDPIFSKDFRFARQREMRFAWTKLDVRDPPEFAYLRLGDLRDIASVYDATGTSRYSRGG